MPVPVAKDNPLSFLRSLGPGLLFAGTAVGVSHLVQATRAGADFGLTLLWLVILANVLKYPAFESGARYAAATGTSLLEGYRVEAASPCSSTWRSPSPRCASWWQRSLP